MSSSDSDSDISESSSLSSKALHKAKKKLGMEGKAAFRPASLEMLSNDVSEDKGDVANIEPTRHRMRGNREAAKVPSERGRSSAQSSRRSQVTDYSAQRIVDNFVNCHLVDWIDHAEQTYANRGRIAELPRGKILAILMFMTGWTRTKAKPGANKDEACKATLGEYTARGKPIEHTGWNADKIHIYIQVQLAALDSKVITEDELGGWSWKLPAKSDTGEPAPLPQEIMDKYEMMDAGHDPYPRSGRLAIKDIKKSKGKKDKDRKDKDKRGKDKKDKNKKQRHRNTKDKDKKDKTKSRSREEPLALKDAENNNKRKASSTEAPDFF